MEDTRGKDIFKHLLDEGFAVYNPAQKVGECTAPYVVVKYNGSAPIGTFSSTRTMYDIMCYVPDVNYASLELYVGQVEASLKKLFPMIKSLNTKTPAFYDSAVKGHMVSMQYSNNRKI